MYVLKFEGRVQSRGSKEAMEEDRRRTAEFTGRNIYDYKIELENNETHSSR